DSSVTGVQTCALPISGAGNSFQFIGRQRGMDVKLGDARLKTSDDAEPKIFDAFLFVGQLVINKVIRKEDAFGGEFLAQFRVAVEIGRASCRVRVSVM